MAEWGGVGMVARARLGRLLGWVDVLASVGTWAGPYYSGGAGRRPHSTVWLKRVDLTLGDAVEAL